MIQGPIGKKNNNFQAVRRKGIALVSCASLLSLFIFCSAIFSFCLSGTARAGDNPLDIIKDETLSYFIPATGTIVTAEDKTVVINLGTEASLKPGMRFKIIREVAPFKHPVTKEILGNLESTVGTLEINEVGADSSTAEVIEGDAKTGDTVRISAMRVNMLFCQSGTIDWYLADSYYRKLKGTERFTMIDTGIESEDPSKIMEEAIRLKADIALLLTAQATESETILTQKIYWVPDGTLLHEMNIPIEASYTKELKFGEEFLTDIKDEVILKFDLPYSSRFITSGDIDGDGKHEIIICTDSKIRIYTLGVDLQPALGGITIEGSPLDEYIWLESIDLNQNGRDEVIVTKMGNKQVKSYVYELQGTEFMIMYENDFFMRKMGNRLLAQKYSPGVGFDGPVFYIVWEGEYEQGDELELPQGINIYDFIYSDSPLEGKVITAYDETGFLNLYDSQGLRLWRSESSTGGFLTTFKKSYAPKRTLEIKTDMEAFVGASEEMIDRGEWSIKDRLFAVNNEVLFVQRTPLIKSLRAIGYKNSQIKNVWWNGLSMEESIYVDNISGTILDYTVAGSKILVLASPTFGIKAGNILKGGNPFRTSLYVYSIKKVW